MGCRASLVFPWGVRENPPDAVIQIVSNPHGQETGAKLATYARIGVAYYAMDDGWRDGETGKRGNGETEHRGKNKLL